MASNENLKMKDLQYHQQKNAFEKCNCRTYPDSFIPKLTCCSGLPNRNIESISLDNVMNKFNFTYRRINQGASLIEYNKNPQSITRTDFIPKKLQFSEASPDGASSPSMVHREIQRAIANPPKGKKSCKLFNYNTNMILHKDCTNSSFKRIMQGNELRILRSKPVSVTKSDYLPKPFDVAIYPLKLQNPDEEYKDSAYRCGKCMSNFLNALEHRDALVGRKQKVHVDYSKNVNEEDSSFLRAMQAANYNNIDPNPISITAKDFGWKRSEVFTEESMKNYRERSKVPLKNCVNMLKLYKNLEERKMQ